MLKWWWRQYDKMDDVGKWLMVVVTFATCPLIIAAVIMAVFHAFR